MKVSFFVPFLALGAFALAQTEGPKPQEREPGLYATVETSHGSIVFRLYEHEASITVKNFVDLATGRKSYTDPRTNLPSRRPFYNGLTFHRVIPEFMIQGGDPLADGTGGTKEIPDEVHDDLKFDRAGRVGMANSGPNTGSCQFFITDAATPHLDGRHSIFGQVVEGQEVVEEIARVPRDEDDKPLSPVTILRVAIQRVESR